MPKASNAWTRWGVAATTLFLLAVGAVAAAGPAAAQTNATPAQTNPTPNPLQSLLAPILAPLAPLLNPSPQPTAPAGGAPGHPVAGGGSTNQPPAPIPNQVEVHCGGVPRPLSFARTPGRTTQPLLDAAAKVTPPGGSVAATVLRIAAPFPVAGSASYRDDWGEPRSTPCPHLHQGNDIFANFGTAFVAPEAGVVERYGFESVGGNSVYFMGDDGYGMYGAHLQTFGPALRVGDHVAAGTVLGYVGNTGDAAGGSPHLHFQLYPPGHAWGSPVDPKFWLDDMLNRAISAAGGVVPVEGPAVNPQEAQGLNVGGLMNSVLSAGGHIISKPTVPVILLVLLVLGVLGMAQTRTFKVAVDLRRSRSSAAVPTFLVGGTAGVVRPSPLLGRRDRHKAAEAAAAQADDRPVWARSAMPLEPVERKPSIVARIAGALGDVWGRLPERMSRVSSSSAKAPPSTASSFTPPPFTPPPWRTVAYKPPSSGYGSNGYGSNGNGRHNGSNGNGHSSSGSSDGIGRHVVSSSLHPWTPAGTPAATPAATPTKASKSRRSGGRGATSKPASWSPNSLTGAAPRSAKK